MKEARTHHTVKQLTSCTLFTLQTFQMINFHIIFSMLVPYVNFIVHENEVTVR